MKAKYVIFIMALGTLLLQACLKDNDNSHAGNDFVQQAFDARYPGAEHVEWERSGPYYVADFKYQGSELSAWFDGSGAWRLTGTELSFAGLPQPVQAAFQAGEYSGWQVEDADLYERPDLEDIYVIGVEQASQELDLVYTAAGILVKTIADPSQSSGQFLPVSVPASAREFIASQYAGALIVDADRDDGVNEVYILHDGRIKTVYFSSAWAWQRTEWEVAVSELPAAVTDAVTAQVGSGYLITEADYVHSGQGDWYLLQVQQGTDEYLLTITPDGQIMP